MLIESLLVSPVNLSLSKLPKTQFSSKHINRCRREFEEAKAQIKKQEGGSEISRKNDGIHGCSY